MKYLPFTCFFIVFLLSGCDVLLRWQTEYPDNFAEEYIEKLIEDQFNYTIDLTPISPEEQAK